MTLPERVARDDLANGYSVSTVCLDGRWYETMVFDQRDEEAFCKRTRLRSQALVNHHNAINHFALTQHDR